MPSSSSRRNSSGLTRRTRPVTRTLQPALIASSTWSTSKLTGSISDTAASARVSGDTEHHVAVHDPVVDRHRLRPAVSCEHEAAYSSLAEEPRALLVVQGLEFRMWRGAASAWWLLDGAAEQLVGTRVQRTCKAPNAGDRHSSRSLLEVLDVTRGHASSFRQLLATQVELPTPLRDSPSQVPRCGCLSPGRCHPRSLLLSIRVEHSPPRWQGCDDPRPRPVRCAPNSSGHPAPKDAVDLHAGARDPLHR